MGLERFSQQLRQGFEELGCEAIAKLEEEVAAEPVLAELPLAALRERVRDAALPVREQDEIWAAIIRRCRQSHNPSWAAVALELLAPALIEVATGFAARSPILDADDLQQQIALEALAALRHAPLDRVRFVKPWLALEVRRRVGRWLAREARGAACADVDEDAVAVADAGGVAWELCELRLSNQRSQDLTLIYRLDVLGESLEEVGREVGRTANAVDCLRRRARRRLRRELGVNSEYTQRTAEDKERTAGRDGFGLLAG